MLQDAFDKGMQRETEDIHEGHLEETNHLRHLNDVGSEKVRAPNLNIEVRPVARSEIMSKRGLDLTRAHSFGILHSRPQIGRAARISDVTDLTLAFAIGRSVTR